MPAEGKHRKCRSAVCPASHQLLGLEEALQVSHLPESHQQQDDCLPSWPPQYPGVRTLAGLSEAFFTEPLVVLLLGDLVDLVQQLPHTQLQFGELLLLRHAAVVNGVLAHLNVQVHPQLTSAEPAGRVGVEADDVLPGWMRGEAKAALRAVHLRQDGFVLGVANLHVHADAGTRLHEAARLRVMQLALVVSHNKRFFRHFFDETFSFCFRYMKVKGRWVMN